MTESLDGRRLFIWLGRNPIEDTSRLATAIAEAAAAELFSRDGSLVWFNGNQLVPDSTRRDTFNSHINEAIGRLA